MKLRKCCLIGEQEIGKDYEKILKQQLEDMVIWLVKEEHVYEFICGGNLGFDLLAAQRVLQTQAENRKIKLTLALPYPHHDITWQPKDVEVLNIIKAAADKVVYTSDYQYQGCLQKHNRYMVDNSDICLYYMRKKDGLLLHTISYALSKYVIAVNINKKFNK